jgi:hypothetical protein
MSWEKTVHHLSGLIRTRVVLALIGMLIVYSKPEAGQWIVSLVGTAAGVSAIDAWRGKDGRPGRRDSE